MSTSGQDPYEDLSRSFRDFADYELDELPTYRAISQYVAEQPDLLAMMQVAPVGQRRPVLLLAAVHYLLLGGAEHQLAAWYPTVHGDGAPPSGSPGPVFHDFVRRHQAEVAELLATRATQTNEVNRSCLWFAAVRQACVDSDAPIHLIEIGVSAGLNLHFASYGYDFGDGVRRGAVSSPVQLASRVRSGRPPLDHALPPIVTRIGLDQNPNDVFDADAMRWLEACIWPEQRHRHERFRAAVAETRHDPPRLVRGDAVDGLAELVGDVPPDEHAVVVNSWVLTYLPRARRQAFVEELHRLGGERTLTWISAEHPTCLDRFRPPPIPSLPPSTGTTLCGTVRWRDGVATDDVIATVHPHVHWMHWHATPRPLPNRP